jgi:hypothetical protein
MCCKEQLWCSHAESDPPAASQADKDKGSGRGKPAGAKYHSSAVIRVQRWWWPCMVTEQQPNTTDTNEGNGGADYQAL